MGFFSFKICFFFGQHESQNFYFFYRAKRKICFRNLTLGYMTKTPNQVFFFLHQNQNIFSATLRIRIFFSGADNSKNTKSSISDPSSVIDVMTQIMSQTTHMRYRLQLNHTQQKMNLFRLILKLRSTLKWMQFKMKSYLITSHLVLFHQAIVGSQWTQVSWPSS